MIPRPKCTSRSLGSSSGLIAWEPCAGLIIGINSIRLIPMIRRQRFWYRQVFRTARDQAPNESRNLHNKDDGGKSRHRLRWVHSLLRPGVNNPQGKEKSLQNKIGPKRLVVGISFIEICLASSNSWPHLIGTRERILCFTISTINH